MTTTPKELADRLRQGLTPLLKAAIGDLEAHYRDLRERELRKADPNIDPNMFAISQKHGTAPEPAERPRSQLISEPKEERYDYSHLLSPEAQQAGEKLVAHHALNPNKFQNLNVTHFGANGEELETLSRRQVESQGGSPTHQAFNQHLNWLSWRNSRDNYQRMQGLNKAEACQKCGDMHQPLEKCGEMADGKIKKEEPKMNPAPLKGRKVVPDQKAVPDAADEDSVLPTDKESKDLTDKDTGSGGQLNSGKLEKIRKAAWSEAKKAEKLQKPGTHTAKEKGELKKMGSVPMAEPKKPTNAPGTSRGSPPVVKNAIPMSSPKIPGKSLSPEDHARALASQAAFTPAAVGEESRTQGAAGGGLKAPAPPPPKKIKIPGRD